MKCQRAREEEVRKSEVKLKVKASLHDFTYMILCKCKQNQERNEESRGINKTLSKVSRLLVVFEK